MRKIITLAVALLCCAFVVYAQTPTPMPRFEIPTARGNGMGGTHIAYTDNVYSLLVNPAAMIRTQERSFFSLSGSLFSPEMTFGLLKPILDIANTSPGDEGGGDLFGDLGKALEDITGSLPDSGKIGLGFDLREFPLSIGWVANGFGFGIWNRIFINPILSGTDIQANVFVDVIVPVGIAFKVFDIGGHSLDAGVTLKTYGRLWLQHDPMSFYDLMDENFDLADIAHAPVIIGAGLDLGIMYRGAGLLKGFSAGATFTDIFNVGKPIADLLDSEGVEELTGTYTVPFAFNLGAAYELKLLGNLLGIVVAADWRDVFSNPNDYTRRNPALNIGLGAQVSLLNMFKVRLGMSDALLSIGAGVDLGAFEISLAYYGKELGLEPGQNPVAALDLTIAFRPEAKKRVWPWARNPIVKL
jgi:hypothetical protein